MFLKDFFDPNFNPNYVRIVVTHQDLDGEACAVLANIAAHRTGLRDIHFLTFQNVTGAEAYLKGYIKNESPKPKRMFLITDLGLRASTLSLLDVWNGAVPYVFIDHHQIHPDDADYMELNPAIINSKKMNTAESATWMLFQCLLHAGIFHDNTNTDTALYWYKDAVSKYDTGRWGDWDANTSTITSQSLNAEIAEQLYYLNFSQAVNEYIHAMSNFLEVLMDEPEYNKAAFLEPRMQAILNQYHLLAFQYELVCKNAYVSTYDDSDGNGTIKRTVHIIPFTVPMFSIISRKYLEDHPNVDFMVAISKEKMQAQLRSAKDGVDVSSIARDFGGGGHKKAAGFPLSDYYVSMDWAKQFVSEDDLGSIMSISFNIPTQLK